MEALDAHFIQFAPKFVIVSTWFITTIIDTLSTPYQKNKEIERVTLLDPKSLKNHHIYCRLYLENNQTKDHQFNVVLLQKTLQ